MSRHSLMGLSIVVAVVALIGGATVGRGAALDYTWTGTVNGDWSNTGNWLGGTPPPLVSGYLVDTAIWTDYNRVIFNGSNMPTTNVPIWGNGASVYMPPIQLNSGGTLTMVLGGVDGGLTRSDGQTPSVPMLLVGDGIGAAGSATFTTPSTMYLARHGAPINIKVTVNKDGVLNVGGDLIFAWDTVNRWGQMLVDGGSVNVTGNLSNLLDNSTLGINNDGDVVIGGVVVNPATPSQFSFIKWDGLGSFTADYGGRFANYAAVQSAMGTDFVLDPTFAAALALTPQFYFAALDNGNSTFTVAIIPEPATLSLLALGSLALLKRQRKP